MSAQGTSRYCALPVYAHYSDELAAERNTRIHYLYAEYADACAKAGERAYAFSTFSRGLREWRREMEAAGVPEWYPAEYMRTYWSHVERGNGEVSPLFVAVMAYSDATFCCLSDNASTDCWMESCERAFRFFGGAPYVVDCTQVRVSETTRATIEAFCRHYKTVLYGARPKTERAAKVSVKPLDVRRVSWVAREVADYVVSVGYLDDADLDFAIGEKVRQLNALSQAGEVSRWERFERFEAGKLLSLPMRPADRAVWATRVVSNTYHVLIEGALYSVPWRYVGARVRVSWTADKVRIYSAGELIAEHGKVTTMAGRRTVTDPAHRPHAHRWFAERLDSRFLAMAEEEGPHVARAMKRLIVECKREGCGFARCKELLDLKRQPSVASLEEACALMLKDGDVSVERAAELMGQVST